MSIERGEGAKPIGRISPVYAPAASEELLDGGAALRRAFQTVPGRTVARDTRIAAADEDEAPIFLINRGTAYRACTLPDGRRVILDILLPGDIAGLEQVVMGRSNQETCAACELSYRVLGAAALRDLMRDHAVALRVLALMSETRWRIDRHLAAVCRLDSRERIAAFVLSIHDRLRRRDLISRATFNLPLTQEQIADYLGLTMVHVNRTLRRMREEKLLLFDRQVVIILDLERMRELVQGLPTVAEWPEPITPPRPSAQRLSEAFAEVTRRDR